MKSLSFFRLFGAGLLAAASMAVSPAAQAGVDVQVGIYVPGVVYYPPAPRVIVVDDPYYRPYPPPRWHRPPPPPRYGHHHHHHHYHYDDRRPSRGYEREGWRR